MGESVMRVQHEDVLPGPRGGCRVAALRLQRLSQQFSPPQGVGACRCLFEEASRLRVILFRQPPPAPYHVRRLGRLRVGFQSYGGLLPLRLAPLAKKHFPQSHPARHEIRPFRQRLAPLSSASPGAFGGGREAPGDAGFYAPVNPRRYKQTTGLPGPPKPLASTPRPPPPPPASPATALRGRATPRLRETVPVPPGRLSVLLLDGPPAAGTVSTGRTSSASTCIPAGIAPGCGGTKPPPPQHRAGPNRRRPGYTA